MYSQMITENQSPSTITATLRRSTNNGRSSGRYNKTTKRPPGGGSMMRPAMMPSSNKSDMMMMMMSSSSNNGGSSMSGKSSNHLYMAPQASIRTTAPRQPQPSYNLTAATNNGTGSKVGLVLLEAGSAGIKSVNNTRRRRRGSSGIDGGVPDYNNNNATLPEKGHSRTAATAATALATTAASLVRGDRSPTMVERQDSDSSLGAMAAFLVADRTGDGAAACPSLPQAPILWAESNTSCSNSSDHGPPSSSSKLLLDNHHQHHHHHHLLQTSSPRMTQRKKLPHPEHLMAVAYRRSNHSPASSSSKAKLKKSSMAGSNHNHSHNSRTLHYGHEDFSETNLDESFNNLSDDTTPIVLGVNNAGDGIMMMNNNNSNSNNNNNTSVGSGKKKRWAWGNAWWKSLWWSIRVNFKEKDSSPSATAAAAAAQAATNQLRLRWGQLTQVVVLLVLAMIVFDSHSKVQSHKVQLQQYDEERSHILEQMLWIDQAAKKVHKKYSEQEVLNTLMLDSNNNDNNNNDNNDIGGNDGGAGGEGQTEQQSLETQHALLLAKVQEDLHTIQHNIQLNAREHLASTFGELPAEVSLKVSSNGEKLLIGLSDDTPHAISTLVQQVNRHLWDHIQVKAVLRGIDSSSGDADTTRQKASSSSVLELRSARNPSDDSSSSSSPDDRSDNHYQHNHHHSNNNNNNNNPKVVTPLLEFVERSHGCHEVGSVSLRQEDSSSSESEQLANHKIGQDGGVEKEIHLVLSVYLEPNDHSLPEGHVCIGRVLQGLDAVVNLHHREIQGLHNH
ncbi:hypothetical protein ACA910_022255 [Epithemia clementina (nom. ined.)]